MASAVGISSVAIDAALFVRNAGSWFYLERNGKLEKRFVISTRVLKGSTITWWGRRRWAIEGFFKTAKYQFGLASFGISLDLI
jgi:hypothetical protein